jgi:two-component system response regulator DevR
VSDDDEKIRVFLLDDHEMVRTGVRDILDDTGEFVVVGEASTAAEALHRIPATSPNVAILDVRLPDGNGVEVCREVRARNPQLGCLMLTSFSDDDAVLDAIMAGASGYLLKQIRGTELVDAVRRVAAGQSLLDPMVTARVLERIRKGDQESTVIEKLTAQERQILEGIGRGLTNRQIAEELYLAEKTVKNYVSHLLTKLGFSRRTEAAALSARLDERKSRPPRY